MNLGNLIELLEEMQEAYGPGAEVRLMTQQNWPFENKIHGVCSGEDINGHLGEEDEEGGEADVEEDNVVYIVEGGQIRYGSKAAWEVC